MGNATLGRDTAAVSDRRNAARALMSPTESGFQQLVRFGIAGVVATFVDYAVLLGLYRFAHISRPIAVAAGYCAGLVVCYLFSIFWIFAHRTVSNKRLEFTLFVAIGIVGLVLTEVVMEQSLHWLESQHAISVSCGRMIQAGIDKCFAIMSAKTITITLHAAQIIAAKFIAIVLVFFFNFAARKALLFAGPKRG